MKVAAVAKVFLCPAPLPRGVGQTRGPGQDMKVVFLDVFFGVMKGKKAIATDWWLNYSVENNCVKWIQMGSSMIISHRHLCNHQLEHRKTTTSTMTTDTASEQGSKPLFYSTKKALS